VPSSSLPTCCYCCYYHHHRQSLVFEGQQQTFVACAMKRLMMADEADALELVLAVVVEQMTVAVVVEHQ